MDDIQTLNNRLDKFERVWKDAIYNLNEENVSCEGKPLNVAFVQKYGDKMRGDLDMDTKYLTIGNIDSLPAPDITWRKKVIIVEGGTGVGDVAYTCLKSSADTYSWVPIAAG